MNTKQESIYGMYRRLSDWIKKNQAVVFTLPEFQAIWTMYYGELLEVGELNCVQETDISGLRKHKVSLKNELVTLALDMSARVVAYSKVKNNQKLYDEAHYVKGDLLQVTEETLVADCKVILGVAKRNQGLLNDYGVTDNALRGLENAITAFSDILNTPKEAQTEKTLATRRMAELFDSLAVLTDKMDALMELLKRSNQAVYASYLEVRKVVQRHGSLMARGQIVDAATGAAIEDAMISFSLNDKLAFVKLSAEAGGFQVKTMDEGQYVVTVSKLGYATQSISLAVVYSDLAVIDVALVKL